MKHLPVLCTVLALWWSGCAQEAPVAHDGDARLTVIGMWDPTGRDSAYVPLPSAKVIITSEYGMRTYQSDLTGVLILDHLPASTYGVSVRRAHPDDPNIQLVGATLGLPLTPGFMFVDTVRTKPISSTGISINEIYSAGPVNSIFFFFDQYIELYNASDSVRYLDGMIIMRVSGNNEGKGPGADEGDDGDIDGVTYAFKFPGYPGEQNYPIQPRQFVVLASDGTDHRNVVSTSYDLSHADWEFYNQFSPEDIDNPNVPNLINIRSDRTVDFLINLVSDVIVLANGRDSVWQDGIDIPTVVDGVEYKGTAPPATRKTLDSRIDRGYVLTPPRYSGRSIQRREPGSDTNDSLIDFEILSKATPGYQ